MCSIGANLFGLGGPMQDAPPRRQALPLAHRAFPFSHFDPDRSHADENPTIQQLDKPQLERQKAGEND